MIGTGISARAALAVALLLTIGSNLMADEERRAEARMLLAELTAENVSPSEMEQGFPGFSARARDDVIAHFVHHPQAVTPKLLARLPYIATEPQRPALRDLMRSHLVSEDPRLRERALYGLQALDDPRLAQAAAGLLDDTDDRVLFGAIHILTPQLDRHPALGERLRAIADRVRDQPEYELTPKLLQSLGYR